MPVSFDSALVATEKVHEETVFSDLIAEDDSSEPDISRCPEAALLTIANFLKRRLPLVEWLPAYSTTLLQADIAAGLVVGVVLVPQAVAYSLLAELPPLYGLYASLAPLPVYALFAPSRHVTVGPFALVAILIADSLSTVVPVSHREEYIAAALSLSLLVGVFHLLMALFRFDVLIALLSNSVLSGFTTASGLVIAASQLKHLLGMHIPRGSFPQTLGYALAHGAEIKPHALALGAIGVLTLVAIAKLNKKFCAKVKVPEQLFLIVIATILSALTDNFNVAGLGPLPVIGEIPAGVPNFALPDASLSQLRRLLQPALLVAIFSYVLTVSISRTLGLKHGYRADSNQELVALGFANIAGSLFSSFPISGSLSRSALVATSAGGHCTPLHSLFTCAVVLTVVLFLTPALRSLPYAALASIVFMAVKGLIDVERPLLLLKVSKTDLVLWLIAFFATLLLGTEAGIGISVTCSLAAIVIQSMRPNHALLGMVPNTNLFFDVDRMHHSQQLRGIAIFRFDAALHFANSDYFREALLSAMERAQRLQRRQHARPNPDAFPAILTPPVVPTSTVSPASPPDPKNPPPHITERCAPQGPSLASTGQPSHQAPIQTPNTASFAHESISASSFPPKSAPFPPKPPSPHADEPVTLRAVILDFAGVATVDSTGLRMLADLHTELSSRSLFVVISSCRGAVRDSMLNSGLQEQIGSSNFLPVLASAVDYAQRRVQSDAEEAMYPSTFASSGAPGTADTYQSIGGRASPQVSSEAAVAASRTARTRAFKKTASSRLSLDKSLL